MQDSPSSAKGCLSLMMMQTPVRRAEEEAGGGRADQGWGHGPEGAGAVCLAQGYRRK